MNITFYAFKLLLINVNIKDTFQFLLRHTDNEQKTAE